VILRQEVLGDDVDVGKLAAQCDGYSGSDLNNLCLGMRGWEAAQRCIFFPSVQGFVVSRRGLWYRDGGLWVSLVGLLTDVVGFAAIS
jgi:hypothetical protein